MHLDVWHFPRAKCPYKPADLYPGFAAVVVVVLTMDTISHIYTTVVKKNMPTILVETRLLPNKPRAFVTPSLSQQPRKIEEKNTLKKKGEAMLNRYKSRSAYFTNLELLPHHEI